MDPNAKERDEDEECYSALIWATIGSHYDIFTLKPIRDKLPGLDGSNLLGHLTRGKGIDILEKLLKQGVDPNDQDNGGSSAIGRFLNCMGWSYSFGYYSYSHRSEGKVLKDNEDSRSQIKGIHLLTKYGAKWRPKDNKEIGQARRDLLTLKPDYTLEFVWIMQKYQACRIESIRKLLRTPSIKSHTAAHRERLMQMVNNWSGP